MVVASEGYYLSAEAATGKAGRGAHGYNNSLESMRAIFMARGPNFNSSRGTLLPPFENVNVYPLVCRILEIKCHKHNGTQFESVFENVFFFSTSRAFQSSRKCTSTALVFSLMATFFFTKC